MLAEYTLQLLSGVFVGIYVARYLGPENFGLISYGIALVSIFMTISRLGMESILVRELSRNQENRKKYISTAFWLMGLASLFVYTIFCIMIYSIEANQEIINIITFMAFGILAQSFMVTDYNFQSQIKAKYSSIAKISAVGVSTLIKIYLVWYEAELVYFAISYAIDFFLISIFLILMHLKKKQVNFIEGFDSKLIVPLLKSSWPMVISALTAMLYMRSDQIMIKKMMSTQDLGLYSVATRIYEAWIVIPVIISLSLMPSMVGSKKISNKEFEKGLKKTIAILFWMSLIFSIISYIYGEYIIVFLYGPDYEASINVFKIIVWGSMFAAIGSVSARYLTIEGMERKIAYRTLIGLLINIILNGILIPRYGIEGSAVATVVTMLIINYSINYIDKDLKILKEICNKAIFLKFN